MKKIILLTSLAFVAVGCGENASDEAKKAEQSNSEALVYSEEANQIACITNNYHGESHIADVKAELMCQEGMAASSDDMELSQAKINKLIGVLMQMEKINKISGRMIQQLDDLKEEVLKEAGENISTVKDKDAGTIIWRKSDNRNPSLPGRFNCGAIKNKGKESSVFKGRLSSLNDEIAEFRNTICKEVGNYSSADRNFQVNLKDLSFDGDYASFRKNVQQMFAGGDVNIDDKAVLEELYIQMTLANITDVKEANVMESIAYLTAVQMRVLQARSMALANWKMKVSLGCY